MSSPNAGAASVAATRLVNPPGVDTVLTVDQLWKGLQHKARHPANFIPIPVEAQVIQDEGDKLVRLVKFGPAPQMREVISSYAPSLIYFDLYPLDVADAESKEPVSRVTNFLSYGPAPDHDLYLTFTFAPHVPGLEPTEAAKLSVEEQSERAGKAVEMTLEGVRDMVRGGKL